MFQVTVPVTVSGPVGLIHRGLGKNVQLGQTGLRPGKVAWRDGVPAPKGGLKWATSG